MKRQTGVLLLVTGPLMLLASGCATVAGSEVQNLVISAKDKSGMPVEKAECVLASPRGSWKVVTPGTVAVVRDAEDIQVRCDKEGQTPGLAKLVSRANGGMFGNVIFGGVVGALIDHGKGTGYEYPYAVVVVMGDTRLIDRKVEVETLMKSGPGPAPMNPYAYPHIPPIADNPRPSQEGVPGPINPYAYPHIQYSDKAGSAPATSPPSGSVNRYSHAGFPHIFPPKEVDPPPAPAPAPAPTAPPPASTAPLPIASDTPAPDAPKRNVRSPVMMKPYGRPDIDWGTE